MKRRMLFLVGGLVAALAVVGTAVAFGPGMPGRGGMAGPGPRGAQAATADHFIAMMVPHHDDAIAMAQLALTRGEHPEVRALAAEIVRTQTAENATMRAWYRERYGTDVPALPMRGMGMGDEQLEDATTFDRAFLEQMIRHHAMGVRMVERFLPGVDEPELRQLMQTMVRTQRAEITQMQAWYRAWYGKAAPAAGQAARMGGPGHCMQP
jgi:uncharacterized protein (DUF305 family)